jgi:formylglycine-generating enzyme required for sulfatase activity
MMRMIEKRKLVPLLLFCLAVIFWQEALAVKLSISGSVSLKYVKYLSLTDSVKADGRSFTKKYDYSILVRQGGKREKISGNCQTVFWFNDAGQLQYRTEIDSVSLDSSALVGSVFVLGSENEKIVTPAFDELFAHQRTLLASDIVINKHPRIRRCINIFIENPDPAILASVKDQDLNLIFSDSSIVRMQFIPVGNATIGTDETELRQIILKSQNVDYLNEAPLTAVHISTGFWISETEIANDLYEYFLKANNLPHSKSVAAMKNLPVTNIDWYEAGTLCKWLSQKLPGYIVRLPHEVEWEYAARGASKHQYPWQGNDIADSLANYGQKYGHLFQIHSFYPGASPFGVLNMAGNVYEWCLNSQLDYRNMPGTLIVDAAIDTTAENRAARGGSFINSEFECRSAARYFVSPHTKNDYIGFRILLKKQKS